SDRAGHRPPGSGAEHPDRPPRVAARDHDRGPVLGDHSSSPLHSHVHLSSQGDPAAVAPLNTAAKLRTPEEAAAWRQGQRGPVVLVKGADYARDDIVGAAEVEAWGGRVVRVPLVSGYSTSELLARLRRGPKR